MPKEIKLGYEGEDYSIDEPTSSGKGKKSKKKMKMYYPTLYVGGENGNKDLHGLGDAGSEGYAVIKYKITEKSEHARDSAGEGKSERYSMDLEIHSIKPMYEDEVKKAKKASKKESSTDDEKAVDEGLDEAMNNQSDEKEDDYKE